ncbi:MAG: hypothetical protein HY738_04445 [Bacteroidia bacterium]|nr:hypothetical protein [Bacteroidia bacterium]
MYKTNIESSIMELLEPKVKEIQDKFSKGEKLGLQDFNLLLLKTQYNHINHLDQKLDEVVADVASLRGEFNDKFNGLRGEFQLLETRINGRLDVFEQKIETNINKTIIKNMAWTIGSITFIIAFLKIIDIIFK